MSPLNGEEHALTAHMLDVAACFLAIASVASTRRALECAAQRALSDLDLMRLAVLAFLHDVGKANAGFQAKQWIAKDQPIPRAWPAPAGHTQEALCIFGDEKLQRLLAELPVEDMATWGCACWSLWRASISHHGRPVEPPRNVAIEIWQPVIQAGQVVYDPQVTLHEIGLCVKQWFAPAFQDGQPLPDRPEFAHLFAGLVQFADWLGSDAREEFFPYAKPGEDRNQWVWQRAHEAVQKIGFNTAAWRKALPSLPDFSMVFDGNKPYPIQSRMSDANWGQLLILESETGSGKTEAALWRFAQLFHTGQVDGLYFALPTRVAATQLYKRTLKFARNLWHGTVQEPPLVVRALAGYESADGQAIEKKLPDFTVLWADHPDEQKAHTRWAAESSKRFLAAPLAVGTIDQALLGALQVRHAHMRHSLLTRSLLVVDEVHASDAYMATLLAHLLQAHLQAGGHALLLSATLGASARHRYQCLSAPHVTMPTLAQAMAAPYPALTDGANIHALPDAGRSKRVWWHVQDCIDNPEAIAALAIDAAKQGAKVLVIRNTVPSAVATFQAIEAFAEQSGLQNVLFKVNGVATVHHSRYSREDRPELDRAVEQQIGKDRAQALQACIVVGTQTLEQSLDIDADLLITDLCPMDVLLQRVGRLHRHKRKPEERPENYRKAQAMVLVPAGHSLDTCLKKTRHGLGRFHNGGGIYMDLRILEATRRLISGAASHEIPRDNRALVERATHPEVLAELQKELGADWAVHGQDVLGEELAATVQGNHSVVDFKKHFWVLDENLYELDVLVFADEEQRISSRLGAGDYLLTFDSPQSGPFGIDIRNMPVRPRMWPKDLPPDTKPAVQTTLPNGGFIFTLGEAIYQYSRLGLERMQSTTAGEME